jgi:hypothetical protein
MNFLTGVVVGIVLATIGAHGVADYVDRGVNAVKVQAVQLKR